MTQLENRLAQLADVEVPSAAPLSALRRRTARRRWRRGAGGVLVAVAAAAGAVGLAAGDDDGQRIDTVDDGQPGPSTTMTTSTPDQTVGTARRAPVVVASASGVIVFEADGAVRHVVSEDPAAAAYAVGTELVAFQASSERDSFPPPADGPVRVWSAGALRSLPLGPGARRALLLDAGVVDGAPVALVAERQGEVGPEDTVEELLLVDLVTGERRTVVRRPAWESGHFAARILPGGDVVSLLSAEATVSLVRWEPGAAQPRWTVEVGTDVHVDLAVLGDRIQTVQMAFTEDLTPVLTLTEHDPATGAPGTAEEVVVADPQRVDTALFCAELLTPTVLACGRAGGAPVAVDVSDGSVASLPGDDGGTVTVVRAS